MACNDNYKINVFYPGFKCDYDFTSMANSKEWEDAIIKSKNNKDPCKPST